MCGITGFASVNDLHNSRSLDQIIGSMVAQLAHRGPDDSGVWIDASAGIALGHRRLAVIDTTADGHQPMCSGSGSHVLIYNGELYNYRLLRAELERSSIIFRSSSDSEVVVEAIEAWGIESALTRFNGMFAFAVWDRVTRTLCLACDRLGEKPVYYGLLNGRTFIFGSELKSLVVHPDFRKDLDFHAFALYLQYGYVPAPHCIYQDIFKLPAGTYLVMELKKSSLKPGIFRYWILEDIAERGVAKPFNSKDEELLDRFEELARDAVSLRLASDVPLGVFLSGGLDSSTVTALIQATGTRRAHTFTIGFDAWGYDEAKYARAVAEHLGTEHTECYVGPEQALAVIPELPNIYDEPFADASQIPTCLLSRITREHVTVSLSSDGGDELFGGYNRHIHGKQIWNFLRLLPRSLQRVLAGTALKIPPSWLDSLISKIPGDAVFIRAGEQLHRLANVLAAGDAGDFYNGLISCWPDPTAISPAANPPLGRISDRYNTCAVPDIAHRMMLLDALVYLPDDLLVKVDRASMAVGLEVRAPFLDHRLMEFAWRLPGRVKIRRERGKWLVRKLLEKYVPRQLFERPKMGFAVPLDAWLREPLRDWAETLLDEYRLAEGELFDPGQLRKAWRLHLSGRRNLQYPLWTVLMFQSWRERWLS